MRIRNLLKCSTNMLDVRLDKQWVIVELSQLLNAWRAWSNLRLRVADVFQILSTTRVRTISRGHKREGVLNAIISHATDGVDEHRMPIAIAPVDRQSWAIPLELFFECRDQISILLVDWTDATEHLVVLRNAEHPFARHIPAAQDVLEERHHIVHSFRPAERDH